jgi:bifunctional pyridoxal-dependent enzyme with beta-cystathionase and maltose regulon repressor activities
MDLSQWDVNAISAMLGAIATFITGVGVVYLKIRNFETSIKAKDEKALFDREKDKKDELSREKERLDALEAQTHRQIDGLIERLNKENEKLRQANLALSQRLDNIETEKAQASELTIIQARKLQAQDEEIKQLRLDQSSLALSLSSAMERIAVLEKFIKEKGLEIPK